MGKAAYMLIAEPQSSLDVLCNFRELLSDTLLETTTTCALSHLQDEYSEADFITKDNSVDITAILYKICKYAGGS